MSLYDLRVTVPLNTMSVYYSLEATCTLRLEEAVFVLQR